jgi:hypothetical protein
MFALASGYMDGGEGDSDDTDTESQTEDMGRTETGTTTTTEEIAVSPGAEPAAAPGTADVTGKAVSPSAEENMDRSAALSLLKTSQLLGMAVAADRVDILSSLLEPLPLAHQLLLLHPSAEAMPYAMFAGQDTVFDGESNEDISVLPPAPPLTLACSIPSLSAATKLLSLPSVDPAFVTGPHPLPYSYARSHPSLKAAAFGSNIISVISADNAARLNHFVKGGVTLRDLSDMLKPLILNVSGDGGVVGDEKVLALACEALSAPSCAALLQELITAIKNSAATRTKQSKSAKLKFFETMQHVQNLQLTYSDCLLINEITKSLLDGNGLLMDHVRSYRAEGLELQDLYTSELLSLEVLLTELDDYLYRFVGGGEEGGEEVSREKAAALVEFRATVVVENDVMDVDLGEVLSFEMYNAVLRSGGDIEKEIEKGEARVRELKGLLYALAEETDKLETANHTLLRVFRKVRGEVKEMREKVAMVKVQQERVRREIRRIDGSGSTEASGNPTTTGEASGVERSNTPPREELTAVVTDLIAPQYNSGGGRAGAGGPQPTSLWGIILRFVFGIEDTSVTVSGDDVGAGGISSEPFIV